MRVFLGITGASGAPYARRLLQSLAAADAEVGVSVSGAAIEVLATELYGDARLSRDETLARFTEGTGDNVTIYEPNDWKAPYASGSAKVDAYVICPCSMGTLGTIASGAMQNLIHRAASVALKEERKLVLCPRETPLSTIHLENMLTLRRAGATILFLAPGFYHGAETVDDLVDFVVARVLDQLGLEHALDCRAGGSRLTLAPDAVRTMFDRIAPVYDVMNRVMTAGLDVRWRRLAAESAVRTGDRVLDAACGTGDLAIADLKAGAGKVTGLDFSAPRCSSARAARAPAIEWVQGDMLALPFADETFDAATVGFGVRNVADLELGAARAAPRAAARRPARDPRDHAAARRAAPFYLALVRPHRPAARQGAAGRRRVHVSARVGEALPDGRAPRRHAPRSRLRRRALPPAGRLDRRPPHGTGALSQLAQVHATPGVAAYMAEVEAGLARAVAAQPGLAQEVAGEALSAGGKRLRPLLCFLTARDEPSVAAGVAVEMVHMATLVHDDLVDGARLRRGLPAAWSVYGADAAKAAGDYLFACAFAVLAETGDERAVSTLADAALVPRARRGDAEAADARPRHDVDAYLERCALKTGKLIEAACLLGSGGDARLGAYGASLGIAFQIADDILDCAGQTQETGKIPGTDLREGTPTMPLLLAAQQRRARARRARRRAARRRARAGRLDRRASPRSREAALDYAARARSFLDSHPHREELEALTYAVVDRAGMIKLGRIGYVNMAPVFFRLEADVEEIVGVPTDAEPAARRGRARRRADLVDRVRAQRRHAAAAAAPLRLERRRRRVDPADLEDAARAASAPSRSRPSPRRPSC